MTLRNGIKIDYNMEMEKILENLNSKKRLLLHACCGPCSTQTLAILSKYFDITIYYYNPNIHPKEEFERRKNELKKFIKDAQYNIKVIDVDYDPEDYFNSVKGLENLGERSKRCYECYKLRMEESIKYASLNDFDYFTTTLSISPHKNSDWINEIGKYLEDKYKVKYLYADLKKKDGYKKSLELSKKYNLYRQDYCGCIYSKNERMIKN